MKKKKTIMLFVCFAAAFAVVWLLQILLMPKYTGKDRDGALVAEYYANAGNNDVIFIGDCEVYESFSPIKLWEEYGITSYVRGSPQQMIWQSYYLAEETFKYETPKIIVFNVLSMKYDTPEDTGDQSHREAYNRMALDGMRWSKFKYGAVLASMTKEEKERDSIYSYFFPILRYHDRWSQLTKDDFKYMFRANKVSDNGYLMQTGIKPMTAEHTERRPVDFTLGENSWNYLEKLTALCEKHGTELVLIKAPTVYPVWWDEWDKQVASYAAEHNLTYINLLNKTDEIGIDWNTDTYDTGLHLNIYGAEKLSVYFGRFLKENFDLPDHRSVPETVKIWNEKAAVYENRKALSGVMPNAEA